MSFKKVLLLIAMVLIFSNPPSFAMEDEDDHFRGMPPGEQNRLFSVLRNMTKERGEENYLIPPLESISRMFIFSKCFSWGSAYFGYKLPRLASYNLGIAAEAVYSQLMNSQPSGTILLVGVHPETSGISIESVQLKRSMPENDIEDFVTILY